MSQPEKLNEGVYKSGEEIIVVLPSDKTVVIEELVVPAVQSPTLVSSQQPSTLQQIKRQFSSFFSAEQKVDPTSTTQQSFQNFNFSKSFNNFKECWSTFDSEAAFRITEFKRQYVLPIGDIPVRSVCMAVSTGLLYAVLGRRNPSLLGRTRNLAISFVVNGIFWVPQTFNPFLFRQNRI